MAVTHSEVMLYYPNLIGYGRFVFTFIAAYYAFDAAEGNWVRFVVCYSIS